MHTSNFFRGGIGAMGLALLLSLAAPAAAEDLTIGADGRVTIELIGSDASFSNTLSVESPGVALASAGCKLEPANGLSGVHVVSEKKSQRGCRISLDSDSSADGVQPFAAGTTFRFGFCAQTDGDAACELTWSSNPGSNSDDFDHVRTTDLAPAGQPGRVFQLAWEDLEKGGDEDFNDMIVVVRIEADTDGDGLWDDWEQLGVDTTGDGVIDLDLPALGANPQRKDLFIEVDWMDCTVEGSDCGAGDTHNHQPRQDAIDAVIQAFANANVTNPDGSTGITLHVDINNAFPHTQFLAIPGSCFAGGTVNFDTVKEDPDNFGPENPRRFAYHYALFTHLQDDSSTSSGCGELPGNDFQVSLGGFSGGVGTFMDQAGTFMHELGHNLGLQHGGGNSVNRKPNYVSVMSYTYQLSGIPPTDPDGSGPLTARIDYSRQVLASLDESSLSEPAGVGAGTDTIFYRCSAGNRSANGSAAVDWNCDGDTRDTGVSSDTNNDRTTSTLDGFFDWANVKLDFQTTGDFEDGVHAPVEDQEIDFETYQEIVVPELALTQTASAATLLTGANVTYTIQVTNNRPGQATGVVVEDVLPAGTSFVSCTASHNGACSGNGRNRSITFPVLPGGGTATITLVANLDCDLADGAVLRNTASVGFSQPDPDPSNNSASTEVTAVNPAPVLSGVVVDRTVLSPPNHKMIDVTVAYEVADNCGVPVCALDVTSNEPVDGLGDGDTAPDWEILDEHHLRLRAERSGTGSGRLYAIGVTCTDSAGNATTQTLAVTVPKNRK